MGDYKLDVNQIAGRCIFRVGVLCTILLDHSWLKVEPAVAPLDASECAYSEMCMRKFAC